MKRKILSLVALALCVVMVLAACGGGGGSSEVRLIMATGGVAGTYYPFGGVMAGVINNHTDMQITVNASGASADNIQQIGAGDAHLALAQNDVMYYAFHGVSIWEERPQVTNLATLMTLYPETVQVVVDAGSGIYTVDDLQGMRVSVGDVGSGVEANANQVLAAFGLSQADITVFNLGFGASADAMRDGQLDAFFVTSAAPNTAVMDLAIARDLRILPIDGEQAAQLMSDYPFYVSVTVDSSHYGFLDAPVSTLAVQATLITSTDLDEELAYQIVRTLIEQQAQVLEGHARGADISAHNAVQSISVDLHPGARRFFEEIGVLP